MAICIYCRTTGTRFPKEHVIPKAFGRFRHNLTLACVCGQCNATFGKDLELALTRDTIEALQRILLGIKSKNRSRRIGKARLDVRVTAAGDWYGARVAVWRDESDGSVKAEPLPQVAFRKNGETEWHWFLEEDLNEPQRWERFRVDAETKIVGQPAEVIERILQKLTEGGLIFKKRGDFELHRGDVPVYAERSLDEPILRAVTKIAFNFLAYVTDTDFALRSDFDPVRDYVCLGKRPPFAPVLISRTPILFDESRFYRQTNGHIVILDWNRANTGIVCLLSLFNQLTYHVALCPNYSALWHPISAGRHFDLDTQTISEIRSTVLALSDPNATRRITLPARSSW
ncbi:MAG TPA: HNH endonuclease [Methylomirabilota bacterium]|nr:HNH endonuclease [Methylomirabilota bacterium]